MAFGVYNDSLCETACERYWPSRSLTTLAANLLVYLIRDEESNAELSEFIQAAAGLHHKGSVYYRQMLKSIIVVEITR